jgi:hypothetical protein
MPKITEAELAETIETILQVHPDGQASVQELIRQISKHVTLSADDLAQSPTRPNEPMWHQQVRNITSHKNSPGNAIYEGRLVVLPGGLSLPKRAA